VLDPAFAALGRGEARAALAGVEEHAAAFPRGRLAAEREFLRIDALRRLGRAAEARRFAETYAARFPRAIYVERVERVLGVMR
jgi:hypothetical protein